MSNFQKIILGIAIATMFVSYCLGANVLIQSVHGFFLVISVLIIAAAIKSGEGIFAHLATRYFLEKKYFTSAFFSGLCALLLAVSVSGTTMFLLIQHTKDTAKLEAAKEFLMTKEKDVEFARQELHGCKSTHVTKCVLPKTAILNEKIAERDEAAKKFAKYTDAKGIDTAWHNFADFVGVSSGDDENSVNTEIFRNLALATLADVIAMILIAVVHLEFFKAEPKDEVKKQSRWDDDFIEPVYNDYKQPERTFNREPSLPNKSQELLSDLLAKKSAFDNETTLKPNVVMEACRFDRMLVVGKMGAGKTSLLAHIAEKKAESGLVLILDPHAAGQWPKNCQIVGGGRNYQEIENMLKTVIAEMDNRFKQIHNGEATETSLQPITVLFDEFTSINSKLKNAGQDYLLPLLTEGRKAAIHVIAGGQDETAGALGLKGFFGLKNAFDLTLRCRNVGGNRSIEFDNSEIKLVYQHPGVFISNGEKSSIPDFKQTLKKIVTPNTQNLKKLNGDIFPA